MRTKLPVTQRDFPMAEGETLVSITDLDSRITYCNPAFVRISGYSREELIGQPHNLVRHPDMPAEAFRDLWHTVKAGRTWSACVKNRRKDGDHYWVLANVTPVVRDGQAVGYMSVRTKPSPAQIRAAESLYATMGSEVAAGQPRTKLSEGEVQPVGWLPRLLKAATPGLATQIAATALLPLMLGWLPVLMPASLGSFTWAFGVAALAVAVCLGGTLWFAIRNPIRAATKTASMIAGGDLAQPPAASGKGEFTRLMRVLNQLSVNMQGLVGDVRREVASIGESSSEVASGALDLSSRTESQASSLQQTAAAMEQLQATVNKNAESTRAAALLAKEANQQAQQGGSVMRALEGSMSSIHKASGRISDITAVIDAIAFQTNLLALNAAVEAARAGEHGRGFAVVAAEVRNLSQRCSQAAREIKSLTNDSRDEVESGSATAREARIAIDAIVSSADKVSQLIAEIASATDQQVAGIGQVNTAVNHLDTTTQQNAAMAEQSAAASRHLTAQAVVLRESVQVFHLKQAA
jgi:aerotaxis receptor